MLKSKNKPGASWLLFKQANAEYLQKTESRKQTLTSWHLSQFYKQGISG